jgi:hypothetical protein
MYIIKFIKSKYFPNAIKGQNIRIGTFDYFKKIEEEKLRDEGEGFGTLSVRGNNIKSNFLNNVFSTQLPPDIEIRFEAGEGEVTDDISINVFVFSTSYVENLDEIDIIRKKCFPNKDKHFFISDEGNFETRCGVAIRDQIRINQPKAPLYIYCFPGKVSYMDKEKKTIIEYKNITNIDYTKRVNIAFLFEKPTRFKNENEFRFVWFCTNKPLDNDYKLYSVNEDYCDININPYGCISEKPVEFKPSRKTISVWDLNK